MLKINNVEISKNPVKTNETFIISVSITEEFATWTDVKSKTLSEILKATWDNIKAKIF